MKQLIYQIDIPVRGKSNLYEFCKESVRNYCDKYNIDYICQTEPILKIAPDMAVTNRNKSGLMKEAGNILVIYEKEQAFSYLDRYDQIAVIDADIYIRGSSPNLFEQLPKEFDWGGVLERDLPLTKGHRGKIQGYSKDMFGKLSDVNWNWKDGIAEFMNMGMMLFNQSILKYLEGQTPTEFIRRKEFKRFVDGIGLWRYSTDQVLLNYWLKKCEASVKYLDWRWNALYRGADDMDSAYFIHFFLKNHLPQKGENIDRIKDLLKVR